MFKSILMNKNPPEGGSARPYAVYGNVYFSGVNDMDTTPLSCVCISPEMGKFMNVCLKHSNHR